MERLSIDEAIEHAKEVASKNRILAESDDLVRDSYSIGLKEKQCLLCAEEHEQLAKWLEELKGYRKLKEQGLLLKIPCKVGDTVYHTHICNNEPMTTEMEVVCVEPYGAIRNHKGVSEIWNVYAETEYTKKYFKFFDIGKTVFLTQTEAEAALKRMN